MFFLRKKFRFFLEEIKLPVEKLTLGKFESFRRFVSKMKRKKKETNRQINKRRKQRNK